MRPNNRPNRQKPAQRGPSLKERLSTSMQGIKDKFKRSAAKAEKEKRARKNFGGHDTKVVDVYVEEVIIQDGVEQDLDQLEPAEDEAVHEDEKPAKRGVFGWLKRSKKKPAPAQKVKRPAPVTGKGKGKPAKEKQPVDGAAKRKIVLLVVLGLVLVYVLVTSFL